MLQTTKMVRCRKAIESFYNGKCTITEHQKIVRENKSTGFVDVVVLENQPCRLSFSTINTIVPREDGASTIRQITKVYLAPEINVKPGSKLTITQNGVTADYKHSGEPARYTTHQEIVLELFKEWS